MLHRPSESQITDSHVVTYIFLCPIRTQMPSHLSSHFTPFHLPLNLTPTDLRRKSPAFYKITCVLVLCTEYLGYYCALTTCVRINLDSYRVTVGLWSLAAPSSPTNADPSHRKPYLPLPAFQNKPA